MNTENYFSLILFFFIKQVFHKLLIEIPVEPFGNARRWWCTLFPTSFTFQTSHNYNNSGNGTIVLKTFYYFVFLNYRYNYFKFKCLTIHYFKNILHYQFISYFIFQFQSDSMSTQNKYSHCLTEHLCFLNVGFPIIIK